MWGRRGKCYAHRPCVLRQAGKYFKKQRLYAFTKQVCKPERNLIMKKKTKSSIFWTGIILLVIPGLVHAYLLMPFPGSQDLNAITASYYLEKIVWPLRIVGGLLIVWYLFTYYSKNT